MTKKYCKELQPNESIVIPLFLDNKNALSHKDALTSPGKGITPFTEGEVKKITATLTPTNDAFFGIFAYSGEEMIGMISKIGNNFNSLPTIDERTGSIFPTPTQNYRRYLTILNHHKNTPIMGCIESSSQPFALDTTTIEVWAHYGNTEVGLNSTFSEPFPDLLQGLSEVN
ncbi:MAG: hypothetical protein LBO09_06870 [Candidatus Peribacteria bacterium]|jgi:hypothetical protein|nr:hypothetical protein [Candidatus Peribacteria bacterium]